MALPEEDRRALLARLAPAGGSAADIVADAVDDGEELREILVDAQGDVVAFTDRRALYVADGAAEPVVVGYDAVEVRQRTSGLRIDALIEGGRLVLDVARGTFARLAVVGAGGPPGRASWLPLRAPAPRPTPPGPAPVPATWGDGDVAAPPAPPWVTSPPPRPGGPAGQGPPPWATSPSTQPGPPGSGAAGAAPTAPPAPAPAPPAASSAPPAPASFAPDPALAAAPPPAPRPAMPVPGMPPPGWHPDPSRRHWWRWWDGADWTEHVADGGPPSIDPLPPR